MEKGPDASIGTTNNRCEKIVFPVAISNATPNLRTSARAASNAAADILRANLSNIGTAKSDRSAVGTATLRKEKSFQRQEPPWREREQEIVSWKIEFKNTSRQAAFGIFLFQVRFK